VWEGTGDELHTNRLTAATTQFGGRILAGITGMLLTVGTYDPDLLWATPSTLEWRFDAPLLEGSELAVTGRAEGSEHVLAGTRAGTVATRGRIGFGPRTTLPPVAGTATRGRTMTRADVDLLQDWLPPRHGHGTASVPWPLLVLTASGLVNRTDYLGHPHPGMVLNRAITWTFGEPPAVEDTLHCVIGPVQQRPSATRPGFRVGTFPVAVVSSASSRPVAIADWVVIVR
jgi:hypothetical protein